MREEFERWYLTVVRGHPNNLLKDENGVYKYVGIAYLAWEAATMIERKACANKVDALARRLNGTYKQMARECAFLIRSNV